MSAPENFFSRWSRLKRDSGDDTAVAPPGPEHNFDPASLPPIDTISVGTDIRAFLQAGVPADLTRAALRRAWVSDPAIRDFIGIAESQWDFNDPTAMPGFEPLRATDDVPRLVAQALGTLGKSAAAGADRRVSLEDAPPANPAPPGRPDSADEKSAVQDEPVDEGQRPESPRRLHGSALPQ